MPYFNRRKLPVDPPHILLRQMLGKNIIVEDKDLHIKVARLSYTGFEIINVHKIKDQNQYNVYLMRYC